MAARPLVGPGIAKVRHPLPFVSRTAWMMRADDALWALLFAHADIISEGAADREGSELVYRGSTSIILPTDVLGRRDPPFLARLAQAATVDPHLRLRAVRIARTEALVRAPAALHPAQMDLSVSRCEQGIRIDVELDAKVDESSARAGRGSGRKH